MCQSSERKEDIVPIPRSQTFAIDNVPDSYDDSTLYKRSEPWVGL